MSQDPIEFEAGDGNLYRYVGNQATNFIDPTGLTWGSEDENEPTSVVDGDDIDIIKDQNPNTGVVIIGIPGRNTPPGNPKSGINQILNDCKKHSADIYELAAKGNELQQLKGEIKRQIESLKKRNKSLDITIIVVGHSYGGGAATDLAGDLAEEIKTLGGNPKIHLITIDAIHNQGYGYPIKEKPECDLESFSNYYALLKTNLPFSIPQR
ncbi:hypothetical protein AB1L30_23185 [Bremerella sp. JC817]|uniref:lipase family protein n=1 Tax=Bremerella sp. JC817 TaxID=3231756 RepID=UPI0034595084